MSLFEELLFQQGYLTRGALLHQDTPPSPPAPAAARERPRLRLLSAPAREPEEAGAAVRGCG